MKELKIFYLEGCPYCRKAMKALEELRAEKPEYADVSVEWIEETRCPKIADSYDYYRVPSVFYGDRKLYECSPADGYDEIKSNIGNALAAVSGA